jgi:hypothetical protein
MKWAKVKPGVYAAHHGRNYAVVKRNNRQWNLLLSATVAGRTVRHGSDHSTMAEAISKAHQLVGGTNAK